MRQYFFLVVLFLGLTQCKKAENPTNSTATVANSVQYATGFSIHKYENFSIVKVSNAYPEAQKTFTYILHKKGCYLCSQNMMFMVYIYIVFCGVLYSRTVLCVFCCE